MFPSALLALLAALPHPHSAPEGGVVQPTAQTQVAEDARARTAFAKLSSSSKKDVLDLMSLFVEQSGTFQSSLIAFLKRTQDRDPATWEYAQRPAFYDPVQLAPGQPIPRRWLDLKAREVVSAQKSILARIQPRALQAAFAYDWASGEVVRLRASDELQRVFENALAGFAPDLDLCEALVERALDDRSYARAATAFGHAYTDRAGGVYPRITLYEAYASGTEFEMPDVDVLGLVHDLLGPHPEWVAPIPSHYHAGIYKQLGDAFMPYYRHRALRTAVARTYLVGDAALDDGYGGILDNLHALWEDCASTPEAMLKRLPAPAQRDAFLEAWTERCKGPDSPFPAGQRRRATLVSDARAVRAALFGALEELGALQATPQTPPKTPH
ncbi:MAG: hypothetical protein JNL28_13315 [Planctomycetes bacterium]|nr:hypothetical protein [Planctomycetota bacterium]